MILLDNLNKKRYNVNVLIFTMLRWQDYECAQGSWQVDF